MKKKLVLLAAYLLLLASMTQCKGLTIKIPEHSCGPNMTCSGQIGPFGTGFRDDV